MTTERPRRFDWRYLCAEDLAFARRIVADWRADSSPVGGAWDTYAGYHLAWMSRRANPAELRALFRNGYRGLPSGRLQRWVPGQAARIAAPP
jgi:hypothetical protein